MSNAIAAAADKINTSHPEGFHAMMRSLDPTRQAIIAMDILDGQVRNGGFRQWAGNDYPASTMAILNVTLPCCDEGKKVLANCHWAWVEDELHEEDQDDYGWEEIDEHWDEVREVVLTKVAKFLGV